ncbi:MAG: hypothetical protein L0170_15070 [Acidobacteria bacterium]|nr:hypothetical protein [Acidobacteriota bacterium]
MMSCSRGVRLTNQIALLFLCLGAWLDPLPAGEGHSSTRPSTSSSPLNLPEITLLGEKGSPFHLRKDMTSRFRLILYLDPRTCPANLTEKGIWVGLSERWSSTDLDLLVVLPGDLPGTEAKAFLAALGLPFPAVRDPDLRLARLLDVEGTPFKLLFDREGRIRLLAGPTSRHAGQAAFASLVDDLLASAPSSPR